ncbi:glycosyltransferase [Sphingomonas sp. BIUV-7]|uniref:Glycosyltransferase n=1 Tax=Sphingomonas natans TaxID=3063330 RepID=A0ABT8YDG5_9SPHN|nr:glycosyltransferase [Sphingomonas sp. BIUV-7]MDO6416387.1 glycosyltransferase [Sphingomonas sp. BIUV-7]
MPEPRIAVITPYYREPLAMLERCHRSVIAQGLPVDHLMVADGHALDAIDGWPVGHVKLPRSHGDNGNTPRGLGGLLAASEGHDFIAFLDADNWYHEGHLRSLVALWEQTRSPVCVSLRTFHDATGAQLPIREPDEEALRHVDTSCLLIHRSGFESLPVWLSMPKILSPICDRVFLAGLLHRKLAISLTGQRTLAFQTQYRQHFLSAGWPVPEGAKDAGELTPALDFLATGDGVTQCVSAMGFWPLSYVTI